MKKVLTRLALLLLVVVCSASAFVFSGCEDNPAFSEPTLTWTNAQYTVGASFENPTDAAKSDFSATYYEREWDAETQKYKEKEKAEDCTFQQALDMGMFVLRGFDTQTATASNEKRTMVIMWQGVQFKISYTVAAAK